MSVLRLRPAAAAVVIGILAMAATGFYPDPAAARPSKCFGKKINRVVTGSKKTVRLKYRDVVWIAGDRVTVIGKPYSVVCADRGRQTVRAGKGRSLTSTGADSDRIILHRSSNNNVVHAGLGNDRVRGSNGHDYIYASPKKNPRNRPDRDVVHGLGGNDHIYDWSGVGNRIYGGNGSDRIYSLGNAVSSVFGGNGSDFLYTTGGSSGGRVDSLFGGRGNDRLRGDTFRTNGPAFLDGGVGDDWIYGTDQDDTVISRSGITKIKTGGGDDMIVTSSRGKATIEGGPGNDTVSYAAHTPPEGDTGGVTVDLARGTARGIFRSAPWHRLNGIENVEGSSFDDDLSGSPGVDNRLEGGLGNDTLRGNPNDRDTGDGGMGENRCSGFAIEMNCNRNSPGEQSGHEPVVEMSRAGILSVIGSNFDDRITIGYNRSSQRYLISSNRPAATFGRCDTGTAGPVTCEAPATNLNGLVLHGGHGNDRLRIANSVPAYVTTAINGGTGKNRLIGGKTKDYMETAEGSSAGSVLRGRGNSDVIYSLDRVTVNGGTGSDVLHVRNVCRGGRVAGGSGKDNLVFAGAPRGVDANLARATAKWRTGSCRRPLRMAHDIESLEGSSHGDRLTLGRRFKSQLRKRSLLGRGGIDILNSRNGSRDTVTTGSGGRKNRVIADRFDRVIWGWGLSGH